MAESMHSPILEIRDLEKTYRSGTKALGGVDLSIRKGEIFALLGPNGAGKTTLIGAICGLIRPTGGQVLAFGENLLRSPKTLRQRIGLVPQEISLDIFDTVYRQVRYSRGMFGCPPDDQRIEDVLRALSLWDKRDASIRELSGGMKRRVMIAKALSHDPELLFLDEPTAGVDVSLRRDMWSQIDALRAHGVTIVLTTHYIEEAQEMADRVGIINKGEILLVDTKDAIMQQLGQTQARFTLAAPLGAIPSALQEFQISFEEGGTCLVYTGGNGAGEGKRDVARLARLLYDQDIGFTGLETRSSTLEDIFVRLVAERQDSAS